MRCVLEVLEDVRCVLGALKVLEVVLNMLEVLNGVRRCCWLLESCFLMLFRMLFCSLEAVESGLRLREVLE
jgi:hypothetical protein